MCAQFQVPGNPRSFWSRNEASPVEGAVYSGCVWHRAPLRAGLRGGVEERRRAMVRAPVVVGATASPVRGATRSVDPRWVGELRVGDLGSVHAGWALPRGAAVAGRV